MVMMTTKETAMTRETAMTMVAMTIKKQTPETKTVATMEAVVLMLKTTAKMNILSQRQPWADGTTAVAASLRIRRRFYKYHAYHRFPIKSRLN